jgi:hypothetical protein
VRCVRCSNNSRMKRGPNPDRRVLFLKAPSAVSALYDDRIAGLVQRKRLSARSRAETIHAQNTWQRAEEPL